MSDIDFTAINEAALAQCPDLLEKLLPGGKQQGHEYVCSSLAGGAGSSCSVNLNTGLWSDFSTGESGKDLIALIAAQQEVNQFEAARILAGMIGLTLQEDARPKQGDKAGNKPRPIMPVPEGIAEPAISHPKNGKPTEIYRYQDKQGRLLGYVCRFVKQETDKNGKRKKEFAPYVYTGQGWKFQDFSQPYPFYGLQNLSRTPPEAPIIILEGEHKASALQAVRGQNKAVLGIYGGSSRIGKIDYSLLANRSVIFWPDNDPAGAKAAIQFAKLALKHAKSVKIIQPPRDVKPTWDCADAIAEGWDQARFRDWISTNRLDLAEFEKLAAKRWGIGQQEKEPEKQEQESGENEQQESILPPPLPVPLAAFPLEIARLIEETASAFFVPNEIPASVILALVSALVGRARAISQKATWQDCGNVWIAIVGKSASGKSPVMRELYRPLKRLEAKAQKQFELEYENYEDDLNEWKSQKRKQEGKLAFSMAKPIPPTLKQCLVDDATLESLANALRDNPKGLQWQRDELSGLLFDMDKYTKHGGGTKARLLSAYDCDSWKTSRSSNSERNIFIPHACISIFGGIQPGMLGKAFEAGNNGVDVESGFLQRFVFVRSEQDQPEKWNDNTLSDYSKKLLEQITGHLWQWDIELDDEGNEKSPIVPVSQEAHAIYEQWFNTISQEAFISENAPLLKKLRSKVQRLCLLLHCMDAAIAGNDGMNPITADCMSRAIMLGEWIKQNELQCWQLFQSEAPTVQPDPLQRAIMQICIEQQEQIAANKDRISNQNLARLVSEKLSFAVSKEQVGKSASKLGLTSCWIGKEKGRIVRKEKIILFTETTVGTVGFPLHTRKKHTNGCENKPLVTVGKSEPGNLPTNGSNGSKSEPLVGFSGHSPSNTTVPTVPTVDESIKIENYDIDPYSDEAIL